MQQSRCDAVRGIAVLFLAAPPPVRQMGNRWMYDEQNDGWGTEGRMGNRRTDGEQTDGKQRVGRQINGWGWAKRQMDGEQKDGW